MKNAVFWDVTPCGSSTRCNVPKRGIIFNVMLPVVLYGCETWALS
jgi:putative transposon-encoded protein